MWPACAWWAYEVPLLKGSCPYLRVWLKENLDISYLRTYLSIFKTLVNSALVLPVSGVKVILNAVVWTPRKLFGNVCPLVAQLLVQIKNFLLFFPINRVFLDIGVQMIMPSDKKFKLVWFNDIEKKKKPQMDSIQMPKIRKSYLSRHCLPVLPLILNPSLSF